MSYPNRLYELIEFKISLPGQMTSWRLMAGSAASFCGYICFTDRFGADILVADSLAFDYLIVGDNSAVDSPEVGYN